MQYLGTERWCWQVVITHRDSLRAFARDIGILAKDTAVAAVVRAADSRRTEHPGDDTIPAPAWELVGAAKGARSWAGFAREAGVPSTNLHVGQRAIGRGRLQRFAAALDDERLDELANSDVWWDRIVSIDYEGYDQVYDLTVPGEHNFVAADLFVHNTAFSLGIAAHAAVREQRPVLFFSLEMGHLELTQRLVAAEARIDATKLRTGRLTDADWTKITKAMGRLGEGQLWIDDNPALTVTEIRSKARRLQDRLDQPLGLIVVDYLQLMSGRGSAESRQVEVAEISRGLKVLARELETPVMALSQLSRQLELRADKRPMLADLRESGCLIAETRVLRADTNAEVTLGELLASGERDVPVWSLADDWTMVPATMTHAFPSGRKPAFRLRLASGREVTATANHPFRTVAGWRRLDELAVGSRVATPRRLRAPEQLAVPDDLDPALVAEESVAAGRIAYGGVLAARRAPGARAGPRGRSHRLDGCRHPPRPPARPADRDVHPTPSHRRPAVAAVALRRAVAHHRRRPQLAALATVGARRRAPAHLPRAGRGGRRARQGHRGSARRTGRRHRQPQRRHHPRRRSATWSWPSSSAWG